MAWKEVGPAGSFVLLQHELWGSFICYMSLVFKDLFCLLCGFKWPTAKWVRLVLPSLITSAGAERSRTKCDFNLIRSESSVTDFRLRLNVAPDVSVLRRSEKGRISLAKKKISSQDKRDGKTRRRSVFSSSWGRAQADPPPHPASSHRWRKAPHPPLLPYPWYPAQDGGGGGSFSIWLVWFLQLHH